MNKPTTLTKFTKFYPNIFTSNGGLKISLPQEFNDLFDNQIRFSDNELQKLSLKYNIELDQIKYYAQRLQTVHILSLIGRSALNFDTSHMWGLYSDNGKGIALEFDFNEVEERMNFTSLKKFTIEFRKKFTIEQINHRDNEILEYFNENFNDSALAFLNAAITSMPKSGNDTDMVNFERKLSSYNITQALADVDFILTIATLLIDENKVSSILNVSDYLNEMTYSSNYKDVATDFEDYLSLSSLNEIEHNKKTNELNKHLIYALNYYCPQYDLKHPINTDIANVVNHYISNMNKVKRESQSSQVAKFQSSKALLWQHESEWRIIIAGHALELLNKIDTIIHSHIKDGNLTRNQCFKNGTNQLISGRSKIGVKTLDFSKSFNVQNIKIKEQLIAIPLLPMPKRIVLGWDFDISSSSNKYYTIKSYKDRFGIRRCIRHSNSKNNFEIIKDFCIRHSVKLVQLKKSVDYGNAKFEYTEIL